MRCPIPLAIAWLAPALLAGPEAATAMEATCAACLDNCCNWAFSAKLALYGTYAERRPINEYSWLHWEQHGFPPVPCRELLDDPPTYQRCVTKAFDRCYKERCPGCRSSWLPFQSRWWLSYDERQRRGISGSKPVELYPGQVVVIDKGAGQPARSRTPVAEGRSDLNAARTLP